MEAGLHWHTSLWLDWQECASHVLRSEWQILGSVGRISLPFYPSFAAPLWPSTTARQKENAEWKRPNGSIQACAGVTWSWTFFGPNLELTSSLEKTLRICASFSSQDGFGLDGPFRKCLLACLSGTPLPSCFFLCMSVSYGAEFGLFLFLEDVTNVLHLLGQDCCLFFFNDGWLRSKEVQGHPERISKILGSPHWNTPSPLISDSVLDSLILSASSLVGN